MVKRLGSIIFLMIVGLTSACETTKIEPRGGPNIKDQIIEGKYALSQFEADRARDIFLKINESYHKIHKVDHCEAAYGVVLADAQVAVKLLNGLIIRPLLTGALAPAPYAPQAMPQQGGYQMAANTKAYDFGIIGENLWASFEPYLTEMSIYAAAVTTIPDCKFSIGVGDEPVKDIAADENPYKWVLNLGDTETPIVQLVFRGRFDGAEARVIETMTRSIMATANFVLAHDLSLSIDVTKIAYLLGAPVDCIRADALDCVSKMLNDEVEPSPVDYLEAAFIFNDNPKLLTKNLDDPLVPQSNRWERRFNKVDNQFARAFYTFRSFFPALLARSAALQGSVANEKVFNEYLLMFRDVNEDGKVDAGDEFGINLTENGSGIKLSCDFIVQTRQLSADEEEQCDTAMADMEAAIETGLALLKELFSPTEEAIGDINKFSERMYGNMAAVDNPSITAERIPINSFDNMLRDFFREFLIDAPTPPFMEFDVKAFFTDPKPLRDFLPYWERSTTAWTGSRFIADSDTYMACEVFEDANGNPQSLNNASQCGTSSKSKPPIYVTAPGFMFNTKYADAASKDADFQFFPKSVIERDVLQGPYDEGRLTGLGFPSDCLNPLNVFSKLSNPIGTLDEFPGVVMYFPLRDPSLNAMIYVNMDDWVLGYDNAGNGASTFDQPPVGPPVITCSDPSGFQLPDNQMLTKAMWLYVDFLADHIAFVQFLGPLLDGLQ